mmetsp:Transcript_17089/g.26014  ORF Transcript_17089/g.26014 Transcript_17089/m.26014 type:complete len:99 (+) Transcript_17089:368-664(+)
MHPSAPMGETALFLSKSMKSWAARRRMPPRKWLRATLFGWAALAASISKEIASYVLSVTHSPSTCSPVGDNEVVGDDEVVGLAVGDNEVVGDDEVVGN